MPANYKNIDEYIANFPNETQLILTKIRAIIKQKAPLATEKISYGMPTFYLEENLIHFAAYKNHIGLYPGPQTITAFLNQLKDYKTSKGAIQFSLNKPIPYELIRNIVKYRLEVLNF